jgi:peptide/nickel transport system permease protein
VGGGFMAWHRGSRTESAGIVYTLISRSAPEFWVGMILLTIFAFRLRWLPASGATSPGVIYDSYLEQLTSVDYWKHLILPALTLVFYLQGLPMLLMRSNMLDVMQEDFITLARMKGISEWRIMLRHAARNALLPVVTAMALGIGYTIGGDVVVETIFSWPGVGRMLVRAVSASDYPMASGAFLTIAAVMVFLNMIADILYYLLDPRVGRSKEVSV